MGEFSHNFGSDIDLSATGDLLYVEGDALAEQMIIKRLLTAVGADIWNLNYGAGLGQFVGKPVNQKAITNAIRAQIFQEASVAQLPEPVVNFNEQGTTVSVTIKYTDAQTADPKSLSFPLGN